MMSLLSTLKRMRNDFNADIYWNLETNIPLLFKDKYKLIKIEKDISLAIGKLDKIIRNYFYKVYRYKIKSVIVLSKFPYTDTAYKIYADGTLIGKIFFDKDLKIVPTKDIASDTNTLKLSLPKLKHLKGKKFEAKVNTREYFLFYDLNNKIYGVARRNFNYIKVLDAGKPKALSIPSDINIYLKENKKYINRITDISSKIFYYVYEKIKPDKVVVSFSGGKDSATIAYIFKDIADEIIYIDTGFEYEETKRYVKDFEKSIRRDITILVNKRSRKLVKERGLPTLRNKWCTYEFKIRVIRDYVRRKYAGKKIIFIEGLRKYESYTRREYDIFRKHPFIEDAYQVFPILDWRAIDVISFLLLNKIPINPLYFKGLERIGCTICPAITNFEKYMLKCC